MIVRTQYTVWYRGRTVVVPCYAQVIATDSKGVVWWFSQRPYLSRDGKAWKTDGIGKPTALRVEWTPEEVEQSVWQHSVEPFRPDPFHSPFTAHESYGAFSAIGEQECNY